MLPAGENVLHGERAKVGGSDRANKVQAAQVAATAQTFAEILLEASIDSKVERLKQMGELGWQGEQNDSSFGAEFECLCGEKKRNKGSLSTQLQRIYTASDAPDEKRDSC